MRYLKTFALVFITYFLFIPINNVKALTPVTTTIDRFVSNLYPKGSHYFWVINRTTTESPEEMIIDINTSVRSLTEEKATESRFLLLVIEGELFAAQKIPLDAKVDCSGDEEV